MKNLKKFNEVQEEGIELLFDMCSSDCKTVPIGMKYEDFASKAEKYHIIEQYYVYNNCVFSTHLKAYISMENNNTWWLMRYIQELIEKYEKSYSNLFTKSSVKRDDVEGKFEDASKGDKAYIVGNLWELKARNYYIYANFYAYNSMIFSYTHDNSLSRISKSADTIKMLSDNIEKRLDELEIAQHKLSDTIL